MPKTLTAKKPAKVKATPGVLTTEAELADVAKILSTKKTIAIDYETRIFRARADAKKWRFGNVFGDRYVDFKPEHIVGLGIGWWKDDTLPLPQRGEPTGVYIPMNHVEKLARIFVPEGDDKFEYNRLPNQFDPALVAEILKPAIYRSGLQLGAHNMLFDSWVSEVLFGEEMSDDIVDTMLFARLDDENRPMGLKDCMRRPEVREGLPWVKPPKRLKELSEDGEDGDIDPCLIPIEDMAPYCIADCKNCLGLIVHFVPRLIEQDLLNDAWLRLWRYKVRSIRRMEKRGVLIDTEYVERLSNQTKRIIAELIREVEARCGHSLNPNSSPQVAALLYDELKLPPILQGSRSVDDNMMERLAKNTKHPIVSLLHPARSLQNTVSRLRNDLLLRVDDFDRVRGDYRMEADTGRLTCSRPNLQNMKKNMTCVYLFDRKIIPNIEKIVDEDFIMPREKAAKHAKSILKREMKESEIGVFLPMRRAFIAPPGMVFLLGDYSQLELRIVAHLSQDPLLMKAYLSDEVDVHTQTATLVGCHRDMAKIINFGITYGKGYNTLAAELDVSHDVAKQFINNFFAAYAGVKQYQYDVEDWALANDCSVRTICGRKRRCPELLSEDYGVSGHASRALINATVQGSAADLIDVSTARLEEANLPVEPVLQVHDELDMYVEEDIAEEMIPQVKDIMENSLILEYEGVRMPVVFEVKTGHNWSEK